MRASAGNSEFLLSPKEVEILDVLAQTTLIVLVLIYSSTNFLTQVVLDALGRFHRTVARGRSIFG